jgi:hypothetical protein
VGTTVKNIKTVTENNTTYNTDDDAIVSTEMHTLMYGTSPFIYWYQTDEST